jgi:hypothetical protein
MQNVVRRSSAARVLAPLCLALVVFVSCVGTSQASGIDSSCHRTSVSFDKLFQTYWTAEGIGYVNWRLDGNLNVYDRCNHGGILGTVYISPGVIQQKGGSYAMRFWYQTTGSSRWTSNYLYFTGGLSTPFWRAYDVRTEDNIGLAPSWRITAIRLSSYLSFYGVAGAARNVTCLTASGSCSGGMGM